MIRSEKIEAIRKILGPTSPVVVKGFLESDHKPHVFEVFLWYDNMIFNNQPM